MGLGPEATQGAPRSSRQSEVVAVLPIVTHTSTPPPIAPFSAPLHSYPIVDKRGTATDARRQQAAARARRAKPGAKGAGKAERSECRAREDYGWGWAGGVTKPNHAPHPTPRPPYTRGSASPKGEARRERAGKAERSECRAREDYGWGWAGGVNKPYHAPTQHPPPNTAAAQAKRATPPNTRGSTTLRWLRPANLCYLPPGVRPDALLSFHLVAPLSHAAARRGG